MWSYFSQLGVLEQPTLVHGNAARVGTTAFEIFAYFDGIDLEYYNVATIKFQKPDLYRTEYPTMFMYLKTKTYHVMEGDSDSTSFREGEQYLGFSFDFARFTGDNDVVVLLDTPGLWYATITLYNSSRDRNVTGLLSFYVQPAVSSVDTEEGTEIDIEDIENNLAPILASYLPKGSLYYLRNIDDFEDKARLGQLPKDLFKDNTYVYDKTSNALYFIDTVDTSPLGEEYVSSSDYNKLADFGEMQRQLANIDVTFATKEWVGDNYVSLDGGTLNDGAGITLKQPSNPTQTDAVNTSLKVQTNTGNYFTRQTATGLYCYSSGKSITYGNSQVQVDVSGLGSFVLQLPNASGTLALTSDLAPLTTAPSSANTSGMVKFVILSEDPETKYDGYIYFITENNNI